MSSALLVYAVYVFGATQDPQARPLTEPFLHHPDLDVREEAVCALAEIAATDSS